MGHGTRDTGLDIGHWKCDLGIPNCIEYQVSGIMYQENKWWNLQKFRMKFKLLSCEYQVSGIKYQENKWWNLAKFRMKFKLLSFEYQVSGIRNQENKQWDQIKFRRNLNSFLLSPLSSLLPPLSFLFPIYYLYIIIFHNIFRKFLTVEAFKCSKFVTYVFK